MGIPRLLEALQANDWTQAPGLGDEDEDDEGFGEEEGTLASRTGKAGDDDDDIDPESLDFGFDKADFEGLRQAIWNQAPASKDSSGGGAGGAGAQAGDEVEEALDDEEIQKVERMMRKLQAARDMSAGLSEEQRKRVAARAVGEVMKEW